MGNPRFSYLGIIRSFRQVLRNDQLVLSILALLVGSLSGGAVVAFREAISAFEWIFFGTTSERLVSHISDLPWWHIVAAPTVGGLVVGLIIYKWMPGGRPLSVADVIESNALHGGRMSSRTGAMAALVSAVSIGAGASVGREGPAVHLGAALSSWIGRRLGLSRSHIRTLLGCGVASAVAASFNAPIAGALFANEVIVGHYALKAFAPIVISSVAGTAISRGWFGDHPAFELDTGILASFWELPAFVLLGLCAGVTAIILMRAVMMTGDFAHNSRIPSWARPAVAGFAVGGIAVFFPEVLGVGYGVTESALLIKYSLWLLIALVIAKVAATAISMGFGFGGGIFSPALVIGALLGGAFGIIATSAFPEVSSGPGAYTVVGMGAVAAAVLGAPISTTLIVFELTSNYALTLAVMIAVVVASAITHHFYGRSFFAVQLRQRGIDIRGGFETEIMRSLSVETIIDASADTVARDCQLHDLRVRLQGSPMGELFVINADNTLLGTITFSNLSETAFDRDLDGLINAADVTRLDPPMLTPEDNLETALSLLDTTGEDHIAVVETREAPVFLGCIHNRDVMAAYNRALVETRHEEHGE